MSYFDKPKHYIYMVQTISFETSLSPAQRTLARDALKVFFDPKPPKRKSRAPDRDAAVPPC